MKVLHLNCDYIWTTLHKTMIGCLNKLGIENTVFSPVSNLENRVIEISDSEYIVKCFNRWDRAIFHLKQLKIINALKNNLSIDEYDLIHAYYLFTDGNYARYISKKYKIPYVVAVRNTDLNSFFIRRPYLRNVGIKVLLDASRIFFLSNAYKEAVISFIPNKYQEQILEKSEIIPNGIDDYWLSNKFADRNYEELHRKLKNKCINLIYAGSIDKNKNIELTLKAIKKITLMGWKLHFDIIGKVVDSNVYQLFKDDPSVTYFERMPKEELIKRYRNADIFIMPSHTESFGLVYAEAMSQGLPVIYTKGQGFDQQFPEGVVGYSVCDTDVDTVVTAILNICNNYDKISQECIRSVDKFNWDLICRRYIDIYESIVSI